MKNVCFDKGLDLFNFMKALLISNTDGSMFKFRKNLITFLQKKEIEVSCITSKTSIEGSYTELLLKLKVNLYTFSFLSQSFLKSILTPLNILKILRTDSFHVVHVFGHEAFMMSLFGLFLQRKDSRFIVTITGLGRFFSKDASLYEKVIKNVICLLYYVSMSKIHKIILLNNHDYDCFKSFTKTDYHNKLVVINGEGSDFEVRNELALSESFTILYASRVMRQKGILQLIEAVKNIPSCTLKVCGFVDSDISNEPDILKLIRNEFDNIEYLGFLSDIRPVLLESNCVCLPTEYMEGLPIILVEALAFGKIIITTSAPGCAELIKEGTNGFLLSKVTPDELTKKITLANNIDAKSSLEYSTQLFSEKYSHQVINSAIYGFYVD